MRPFYVYLDSEYHCFYYYDPKTSETTYSCPDSALFVNPDTLELIYVPPISNIGAPWKPHFFFAYPDDEYDCLYYFDTLTSETTYTWPTTGVVLNPETFARLSGPDEPTVESAVRAVKPTATLRSHLGSDPLSSKRVTLPKDMCAHIHNFQVTEYAREFFRERHSGIFGRRISMTELSRWQKTPLKGPLLKKLGDNWGREAVRLFKLILSYTGADGSPSGGLPNLEELFQMIYDHPELRDELYFQLIKQTTGNLTPECRNATWSIFLVAASTFPSSRDAEETIRAHISQCIPDEEKPRIADLIQFTGYRFYIRCLIGKPIDHPLTTSEIMRISIEHLSETALFSASLQEQMWAQRKRFPNMPIPIIPHNIATEIIKQGGENREGIFRLPGNMKKIKELQERMSAGASFGENADLNDLASLFKSWYGNLPEPIISKSLSPELAIAAESNAITEFANQMEELPRFTLKYLIGFLRKMAEAAETTKMTVGNLAMCFAPNLIDLSGIFDQKKATKMVEYAQTLIIELIESWDVSEVYPLSAGQAAKVSP
jgi:hypothetical protein